MLWPDSTSRTASCLNSSVYLPRFPFLICHPFRYYSSSLRDTLYAGKVIGRLHWELALYLGPKSQEEKTIMDAQEKSSYPTDQQLEEMFNDWKKDGKEGIREVLNTRHQERMKPRANQGYPTREELAEVLEAHKKGGEAGILAYLKKKRAERKAEPGPEK